MAALNARQRLFLQDLKWRTVPWLQNAASKLPQSELLDILVTVPGILQDLSNLKASSRTSQSQCRCLRDRVEAQLLSLFKWRWLWHGRSGHEVRLEPLIETTCYPPTSPLGRLKFSWSVVATEVMLYNTTLMWLLAIFYQLNPPNAIDTIQTCAIHAMPPDNIIAKFPLDHPLWPPGSAVTLREPMFEVCRTLEWITRHRDDSGEPLEVYLFPISMAMTVLRNIPSAMAWVKALLHSGPGSVKNGQGASQLGLGFNLNLEAVESLGTDQVPLFIDADKELFSTMKI